MNDMDHPWLHGLECPFSWKPRDLLSEPQRGVAVSRIRAKDRFVFDPDREFTFRTFVLQLLIGYELHESRVNSSVALSRLEILEQRLHWQDITSREAFFREVRRAQWHVVLASRAFILAAIGHLNASKAVVGENFDRVSAFTSVEVGALHGIRAGVLLEYGPAAATEALRWADQAIEASPRQARWHLLAASALEMRRKAMETTSVVSDAELLHLERAEELCSEPQDVLGLAAAYQRVIREGLQHSNKTEEHQHRNKTDDLNLRILQLYRKILPTSDEKIQALCLDGMMKLPRHFLNISEIEGVVSELTSRRNASALLYNTVATYYLKIKKDLQKALQYLRQGVALGDFTCSINELRVRVKLGQDLDLEAELMRLAERFKQHRSKHHHILALLGEFYIFKERSIRLAADVFIQILQENPFSKAVLAYHPMFLHTKHPLNLLPVIINEVRVANVLPLTMPVGDRAQRKLLEILRRFHPALLDAPTSVHLVDRMLDASARAHLSSRPDSTHPPES